MSYTAAFAGYVAVTILLLRPVVWHFATRLPHDLGDPLFNATLLWWNAHTVPLTERWWNGFFFAPATGVLAFSDHRLGESLIASPIQWLGGGPIAAYNFTLLATFPLCAIAAHWLAHTLTGRHDAGLIAGLVYGFNPYRFAHIEHLELLAAFGMPAALAALHLYLRERRSRWLVAFGAALIGQALFCSYYALFFSVMLVLWCAWFARGTDADLAIGLYVTVALALLALGPLAVAYHSIHNQYGFVRGFDDIIAHSADVTSLLTASPLMTLWRWTAGLNGPERQLFPGATIFVLVTAGLVVAIRHGRGRIVAGGVLQKVFAAGSAMFALVAILEAHVGPWALAIGPVTLSVSTTFKPLSLAALSLIIAAAMTPIARNAYERRSPFAFYAGCAIFLFLCSLGPKPTFLGHQFLYEPPYAWLMRLSVFGESIRVPARFAMPAILALAACGALAFVRLNRTPQWTLAIVTAFGICADGWASNLPMVQPPSVHDVPIQLARGGAVLLELPLGDVNRDVSAMFRATLMNVSTINGYSGFEPSHYEPLRFALRERDETVLDALAADRDLLIAVDERSDRGVEDIAWLRTTRAEAIGRFDDRCWFRVAARPSARRHCDGVTLPVARAMDRHATIDLQALIDGRDDTFWISGESQHTGEAIDLDLGAVRSMCGIDLALGSHPALFPRLLRIETSADGMTWQTSFFGKTGGLTVLAAVQNPTTTHIELPIAASGRFIRLRLATNCPQVPWIVTEMTVIGS